jgi:AcrR family transcriptional regulator
MEMSNRRGGRSGRRPGPTTTRHAILEAARGRFGEAGYDRTSLRAIAADAGVDQALIVHFFGSKIGLFLAAVDLPFDAAIAIPTIVDGPRDGLGDRVARFMLAVMDNEGARATVTAIVRAATSEPEAARLLRDRLTHELWGPVARSLRVRQAEVRIALVGSQIIGLVLARYVVKVEPLASLPAQKVAAMIAPTLQRYLVEPL